MSANATIRIAETIATDLAILSDWIGRPYAAHLRGVIENYWENPGTQALIRRAKAEQKGNA